MKKLASEIFLFEMFVRQRNHNNYESHQFKFRFGNGHAN
jgi:hypothetical protein